MVTVRPGADELAYVQIGTRRDPAMVTWELDGGARAFSFTGETDNPERWEYFLDVGANLMIYVDGRPVPQDLALVHGVRNAIQEVATRRSLLVTLSTSLSPLGPARKGL